jgi:hypothetical protein
VPKEDIINMKGLKWFGFQRPLEGHESGDMGGLAQGSCEDTSQVCKLDMCCPSSLVEGMETITYLTYHCSCIALFRLHLLQCLLMVGCLCHMLTHEQPTWFDYCVGKLFFHGACFHIYLLAS